MDNEPNGLDLIFAMRDTLDRGEPLTFMPLDDHGEIDPNGTPEVVWPDNATPPPAS